jgi:hypothetical protein
MKTLNLTRLLGLFLLILASCNKADVIEPQPKNDLQAEISTELVGGLLTAAEEVAFCSSKTVTMCAGQHIAMGNIIVKTAAGNLTYVTFKVDPAWSIKELHLYVGPDSGVPVNNAGNAIPGQFPYKKKFNAPYNVKEYTFVISDLPQNFTVAAHSSVVKLSNAQSETSWGDGCEGKKINGNGGSWGTKFDYTSAACYVEPEDMCANPTAYFFEPNDAGNNIKWRDVNNENEGNLSVANFNYTEEEGRAIYSTGVHGITPNCPGAKKAFVHLSTLKLSYTDYNSYFVLNGHVNTVETWLNTKGKLNSSNLPNCNATVSASIDFIANWVETHPCPGR